MITIEETVVIDRPRAEVWAYVTDPANDTVWMDNVVSFEADWDDEPRVGQATRRVAKVAGRRCEMTCEVTDVAPAQELAWKSVQAPFSFRNGFRLEDVGDATRFTFFGQTAGMDGFFGKLADPLVARLFARDMRSNLQRLKRILERSSVDLATPGR